MGIERSGPREWTVVAARTVSPDRRRTPSTESMVAAYIRASARAVPTPVEDGICACSSSGRFHMSLYPNRRDGPVATRTVSGVT